MTRTNKKNKKFSPEFSESCNKLKFLFPNAVKFFNNLENNIYEGFWLGTAKNAHLYYNNFFLAHVKASINKIIFSSTIEGSIFRGTSDNHKLLFAEILIPELNKAKANKQDWIRYEGENIIITNQAPEDFFDRLIKEIKKRNTRGA